MYPFIYIISGFIIGFSIARFLSKGNLTPARVIGIFFLSVVLLIAVLALIDQLPCFLGIPNCD